MAQKQEKQKQKERTVAPGDEKFLQAKASKEDIRKGNFTRVTTLSYDEVEPS